jgi:hypothetical protein
MEFKKGKRHIVSQDEHGKTLLTRLKSRAKIMEKEMEVAIFYRDGGRELLIIDVCLNLEFIRHSKYLSYTKTI